MFKKKTLILYVKLFRFKLFFNNSRSLLNQFSFLNFLKIFKFLKNLKNFGVFIPEIFFFQNNWIFSFWKKGFISNFKTLKWFFVKLFFCKKLPSLIINLTENNYISKEVKNKNIPLINFFKISTNNKKNLGDYFLYNVGFLVNIDILFFFIKVFKFIKFYKNV